MTLRHDVPVETPAGGTGSTAQPSSPGREHGPAEGFVGATGWRARIRRTPGGALFLRVATFLLGLFFVLLGIVLAALPGPLTIPPILLGVWIWSREFAWADRLLARAKRSAVEAWEQAKRRPVVSAVVTGGGLVAAGVAIYLASRYDLFDRAREFLGA